MSNFWIVNHGIENHEELIDLDQIVFAETDWKLVGEGSTRYWNGKVKILFKNGVEKIVELTEQGFKEFCKRLTVSHDWREEIPEMSEEDKVS